MSGNLKSFRPPLMFKRKIKKFFEGGVGETFVTFLLLRIRENDVTKVSPTVYKLALLNRGVS